MRILIGPTNSLSGSHSSITTIEGATYFRDAKDFIHSVKKHQPDVVFLRAVGQNNVTPHQIKKCPVPVVGFYHDWVCWGSERLEFIARQVDWLITEKTAYEYLQNMGIKNCSHFLLMSKLGVERVIESKTKPHQRKKYDFCCLGSFMIDGYKNVLRYDEKDKISVYDNTYWSRLGFRSRSKYISMLAEYPGKSFIAADTYDKKLRNKFSNQDNSFQIISDSLINIHIDHGRKYAANRCFETMALGTLLFCEEGNEIFDFIPEGLVESYTKENLYEKINFYKTNPKKAIDKAMKARDFCLKNFSNNALTEQLINMVKDNFSVIKKRSNQRQENPNNLFRSIIHWQEGIRPIHTYYKNHLNKDYGTAVSLNEKAWFFFDFHIKHLGYLRYLYARIKLLLLAYTYINKAIKKDPNNVVFYWNKAIILYKIGLRKASQKTLKLGKKLLEKKDFSYDGSRLEIKIDWWMSGHIEYDLAIKKIKGNHQLLEKAAFLYRFDMMLAMMGEKNDNIHWKTLPDEYKKIGDMKKVNELDPLHTISDTVKNNIQDFN